jgi:hypothetical protein
MVRAGDLIKIALMLASVAQGSDYRALLSQAKPLQRMNDASMPTGQLAAVRVLSLD